MNKSDELQSQADAFIHGGSWYESAEIAALQTLLGDAKSFADVGSSIGPYSEAAARCLKNAKILALEAHPQTYQVLCRKMEELAQVCAERSNIIETVHAAASNEAGTIDFYLSQSDILTSTMAPTDEVTKEGMTKVEVRAVTLDQLFPETPPDFVKLDVEGVEWRVLAGAEGIHRKGKTSFLVEIHPWGDPAIGKRPSDVLSFMSGRGYGVRRIHRHWLFEPSKASSSNRLKSVVYGFILNYPVLRKIARKAVEMGGSRPS